MKPVLRYHIRCSNYFPDFFFLAHVLGWIKTYNAEFQRNPPAGLGRMMYKQRDIRIFPSIYASGPIAALLHGNGAAKYGSGIITEVRLAGSSLKKCRCCHLYFHTNVC